MLELRNYSIDRKIYQSDRFLRSATHEYALKKKRYNEKKERKKKTPAYT